MTLLARLAELTHGNTVFTQKLAHEPAYRRDGALDVVLLHGREHPAQGLERLARLSSVAHCSSRCRIWVRSLDSLVCGAKYADKLVRFAYKTLTLWHIDPNIVSVLGI